MTEITVNGTKTRSAALDYRRVLGRAQWNALPRATRRRFAEHRATYRGVMGVMRANWLGRLLAFVCLPFGAPLPLSTGYGVPAVVEVEEERDGGGSVWTRRYEFGGVVCPPVRSVKCVDEFGDVVERLGAGLRMRLRLTVRDGRLFFDSDGYYLSWLGFHIGLPRWFLPGHTRVIHTDLGEGRFRFTLRIFHEWFGELFYQDGVFAS